MEVWILQFFFGLRDSFDLAASINRYLSADSRSSVTTTLTKLFLVKKHDDEFRSIIAQNTLGILKKAATFMIIVLSAQWIRTYLENYLNFYLVATIYWLVVIFVYMESALFMWIHQSEIGQEVVNLELHNYKNISFVEYQLDTGYNQSALTYIHRSFSRILFSILFQLQTNTIVQLISWTLPFPINYMLRIPIFALFLSVVNQNTKIPFQSHLPFYYDSNLFYLVGLNILQSCLLHVSKFPIFTGMQWALQPFFILNSITREPPKIILKHGNNLQPAIIEILTKRESEITSLVVERHTYKEHLRGWLNHKEYQEKCLNHKGYMSLPGILTPYTQKLLEKILKYMESHIESKDD